MQKLTLTTYTVRGGQYVREEKEIEAEFVARKEALKRRLHIVHARTQYNGTGSALIVYQNEARGIFLQHRQRGRKVKYIASCSFGKDSLAAIIVAEGAGVHIDKAIYCRIMFDREISAELPEHTCLLCALISDSLKLFQKICNRSPPKTLYNRQKPVSKRPQRK